MNRSKSSGGWLREHFKDEYVKKAQAEGLRSRAAYKLEELIARDRLLWPGSVVVDLGAAPGSWSELVQRQLAGSGRIFALDILPMQDIAGVDFVQGDFREESVLRELEDRLKGQKVDLVLSDLAPNMSGVALADQIRAMALAELALDFSRQWLRPGGSFLVKLFQGSGFDDYLRGLRTEFSSVTIRKPKASRARSREVYALAAGHRAASMSSGENRA
ncbi:MAG: 23S rRNA (uridine(2552)-2'-O)-methyltransferase RlmE [Rhodanobacter sp.]